MVRADLDTSADPCVDPAFCTFIGTATNGLEVYRVNHGFMGDPIPSARYGPGTHLAQIGDVHMYLAMRSTSSTRR